MLAKNITGAMVAVNGAMAFFLPENLFKTNFTFMVISCQRLLSCINHP